MTKKRIVQNGSCSNNADASPIRGVLFDVDGTLYYQAPVRIAVVSLLLIQHVFTPGRLPRLLQIVSKYRRAQESLRKDAVHDPWNAQLMRTALSTGASPSEVLHVVQEWFETKPLPMISVFRRRGLIEVLQSMRQDGLVVGVFSDYPAAKKLEALGVSHLVATIVSASDPGVYGFKPVTNGFAVAAEKMGLRPEQIIYIGDRPEVDGLGAKEAGMQTAILRSLFGRNKDSAFPTIRSLREILSIIEGSLRGVGGARSSQHIPLEEEQL